METHSNKFLVILILTLLTAATVASAFWLSSNSRISGRAYDIISTQSVAGLVAGSPVTFAGVPVGRIISVEIDPDRPDAVRIRIDITDDNLPIVVGTVARLSGDLVFGTALISLENTSRSAPPLLARAGHDVPIIPLDGGGMGAMVSDPAPMLERIASATSSLLAATSPEQRRMLSARLREMERSSAEMAAEASSLGIRIDGARQSLRDSTASTLEISRRADLMRRGLDQRSRTGSAELRSSLAAARDSTDALDQRLQAARVPVQGFSQSVVGISQTMRGARDSVVAVREQLQQIERDGVGALISGPPAPDYRPENDR